MATIIASILDNDLYKFSMGYGFLHENQSFQWLYERSRC